MAIAFAVTVAISGCSSSSGAGAPSVAPEPQFTDNPVPAGEVPLSPYSPTTLEQFTISKAETILVHQCMQEMGFKYTLNQITPAADLGQDAINKSRLYGISDPAAVATYGYSRPPGPRPPETFDASGQPDEFAKVYGNVDNSDFSPGWYQGKLIPVGGCLGKARQQLWGSPSALQHVTFAGELAAEALYASQESPQYKQALADWVKCMSVAGYPVKPGFNIANPFNIKTSADGSTPPSPTEVKKAQADLACRTKVSLDERWSALMTAEEEKLLTKNQTKLNQQKTELQDGLAKARAVIQNQKT